MINEKWYLRALDAAAKGYATIAAIVVLAMTFGNSRNHERLSASALPFFLLICSTFYLSYVFIRVCNIEITPRNMPFTMGIPVASWHLEYILLLHVK